MYLLEEVTLKIIDYLNYDDIINLKKSGIINNLPNNKLHNILSKKLLIKMMNEYDNGIYSNQNFLHRFCFSGILSNAKFCSGIELTTDQINKMISILTTEQLEKLNNNINNHPLGLLQF